MLQVMLVLTNLCAALVLVGTLAHALEYPGKLRLDKATYRKVQAIYYPGFTRLGLAEPLAVVLTAATALVAGVGSPVFWTLGAATLLLLAVHGAYWLLTHPVNRHWLAGTDQSAADAAFFGRADATGAPDWTRLRDRWERSHLIRAALALPAVLLTALAAVL